MSDAPLFDGEARKREGIAAVATGRADWLREARAIAEFIARRDGRVTSDDLQDRIELPEGAHVNLWGSVLRAPHFRQIGYEKSRRPEAHARVIGIWRLP